MTRFWPSAKARSAGAYPAITWQLDYLLNNLFTFDLLTGGRARGELPACRATRCLPSPLTK